MHDQGIKKIDSKIINSCDNTILEKRKRQEKGIIVVLYQIAPTYKAVQKTIQLVSLHNY